MKMMNRHYAALSGANEDVVMPFELSGMHVDRRPPEVVREATELSGIGFGAAPPIQPRPAPVHYTAQPQSNLGSIYPPTTARRKLGALGVIGWTGAFFALAAVAFYGSRFFEEDD
jgi:hypothetical protein